MLEYFISKFFILLCFMNSVSKQILNVNAINRPVHYSWVYITMFGACLTFLFCCTLADWFLNWYAEQIGKREIDP
jgi:hypothetical protein